MAFLGLGSRSNQPNRLGSIQVGTSEYGVAVPIGWGDFKAPIKLVDYTDFSSVPQSAGGKGGEVSSYEYYAAVDALICKGPIGGYGNLYDSGGSSSLLAATETYTIPSGGGTYNVQYGGTAFYYDEGVTYPVNYSIAADDFGSDGSVTLSGTQPAPFERTTGTVGALEYSVSTTGAYSFSGADAGKTVTILYTYTTMDTTDGTDGFDARSPILRYGIAVALGTTPQAPWSYMLGAHPERALRYDGLARILCQNMDLGSSATTPSLSVEVLNGRLKSFGSGISDCDPAAIITDAVSDDIVGASWPYLGDLTQYSNFCVANNLFMSPFLDSTRKVLDFIQELCDLTNSAPVWSGNALKIVPYGDTSAVGNGRTFTPQTEPIYVIDEDELLCAKGEEAVRIGRTDLADNYNIVQFEYSSRNDNYNTALIHQQDAASIRTNGRLPMKTVSAQHYRVQLYAAIAMNMLLRRNATPLGTYECTLPWYFQLLEPMDIIQLNLELAAMGLTAIRIVSIEEQEDYSLKVEAEDFLYGVAEGVVFPKGGSTSSGPGAHDEPGNTTLQIAFLPSVRVTGGDLELWLALNGGSAWGGCDVLLSLDDVSYSKIGTQYGGARAGVLTAPLGTAGDPDTTDTAAVTVTGALATVSETEADAFATLSLLGSELLSYETATLTGSTSKSNSYNLTYLRRGVFSTITQAHAAGERFVRLDDSIFKYVADPTLAGKTVYLKFTSFNLYGQEEQSQASVTSYPITLGALSASNMAVSSSANSDGSTATVSVNKIGGAPTDSGTATLANGTTITIPPYSWASEALSTWYGVNYNPTTAAYVLYTSQSLWAADQATMVAIGSTTTPAYVAGGSRFNPGHSYDSGTQATSNPTNAYDSDPTTYATVSGRSSASGSGATSGSNGQFTVNGFAPVTLTAAKTLHLIVAAADTTDEAIPYSITVSIAGVSSNVLTGSSTAASADYPVTIPSGTDISTVFVTFAVMGTSSSDYDSVTPVNQSASLKVYDVYIQ